jgi:hypothetical protein
MESAKGSIVMPDTDIYAARRTASQIIHLLDRFIPDACREDAYNTIAEASYKEGYELTSYLMRKQYEEWQKILLEFGLNSSSVKPE